MRRLIVLALAVASLAIGCAENTTPPEDNHASPQGGASSSPNTGSESSTR